jgi:cellulose synthase/poly-beta-1,6-N-acetylglucosamine synthase-like glycosyltransferase
VIVVASLKAGMMTLMLPWSLLTAIGFNGVARQHCCPRGATEGPSSRVPNLHEVEFSVCIPAYNEAGSIEPLLDSICRPHYERHRMREVIVYDDCSTDATASIVEARAAHHPAIRLIRGERRLGNTPAAGRLYAAARGAAVVRVNADIAIDDGAIERLVDAIDAGAAIAIGANEPVLSRVTMASLASSFSYDVVARLKAGRHRQHYAVGQFIAYRGDMLRTLVLPPDVINDDHFVAAHIVAQGGLVVDVPEARCRLKPSDNATDYWRTSRRVLEGERQLWRRYGIGSSPLTAKLGAIIASALRRPLSGFCWSLMYCWSSLRKSPTVDSAWPMSESTKGLIG